MIDKRIDEDEVIRRLRSGMTIGIGGWASRRKPMSLVRAILRSDLTDLHLVSYGGPDVGMLCAAGKVAKLSFAFVSLDSIPLEPHFRRAREGGLLECVEMDEGMMLLGLQAAAWRVPFLPTRVGLGSDLFKVNPGLRTVRSPYPALGDDDTPEAEGEELVAVPALNLDAALVHYNRGDARGNAQFLGPDPYFDDLMLEAARLRFVSVEEVVPTDELVNHGCVHSLRINRLMVDGVVEAPNGAHPTSCDPSYATDEAFQKTYAATAKDPAAWDAFRAEWLTMPERDYQTKVAAETMGAGR